MASRRIKLISLTVLVAMGAGGWFLHNLMAAQAQGALAQAPLNNQVQVPPAFIMAVDDSGSMTFHNQLPAADGYGCWSRNNSSSPWGFFNGNVLRTTTSSGGSCRYAYSYTGPRIGNDYFGIPPVDGYGFARSPDFNPAYFDPEITYLPWLNSDGTPYGSSAANPQGNASITATRIDPRQTATINLAANLEDANDRNRVQAFTGMFLPAGTRFRLTTGNGTTCGGLTNPGGGNWGTVGAGGVTMSASCAMYIGYYPATFYLRETVANTAPTITAPGYASITPVRIVNACGTDCHLWKYTIGSAHTEALQNFANWFSFYGNRQRAMIAGMTRSMAVVNNMRVGYFRINGTYNNIAMRDMAIPEQKAALYTDMIQLPASGSTPNLPATNHMGVQFQRTDAGAPVQLACQRNAGMLFTDGFSNVAQSAPAVTGLGAPFDPTPANSMAAIASRFYFDTATGNSPLRPDLPAGLVPVPSACSTLDPASVEWKRLDCQRNLHMNFYGVTLGGRGDIFNPDIEQDPFTLNPAWPGYVANSRSTIDDIWHATVNTRGEFISARTPADISEAMRRILSAVSAGASPSGSLALSGPRLSARSLSVQPSYEIRNEGTDWFGSLSAFRVTLDTATREISETQIWEASNRLATLTPVQRSARTWYGHSSGASQFNGANVTLAMLCNNPRPGMSRCNAAELTALGVNAGQAVSFLMGDGAREVGQPGGTLRQRTNKLGDIVNSNPVVSAPTDDYGYRSLPAPYGNSYNSYMTTKQSRPAMVYVGANDGMLHAFHGGINHLGQSLAGGGVQQFAYIPRTVLGHMGNLLFPYVAADGGDQKFDHRYYVDGPITVSDAYYGGSWRTVLVGSTGAGGRGVFGLNITNPTGFTASSRLWEIDDQHPTLAVRNNIGHVLGKPVIVPVRNAGGVAWKAIFGNGYNSNNGRAVLFVVDIGNGSVQMIEAIESGAPPAGTNGLGNIIVVDRWGGPGMNLRTRDGYADTVYAADQKGAIWRFDLRSATTSVDTPVFVTQEHLEGGQRYRQPIIGGLTATSARGGGVMLLFGTGSFSFVHDAADSSVQALYGVLDLGLSTTLNASNLSTMQIASSVDGVRTIQAISSGSYGWTLALPGGERMVGNPRVASGVVFFPTYAPSVTDGCSTSGFNWLYGLNTRTGGPAMSSVRFGSPTGATQGAGVGALALDTGGTAPVKDIGLTVLSSRDPEVPACDPATDPTCVPTGPTGDEGCFIRITVPGMDDAMFVPYPCGRQSWRQLL